MRLKNKKTLFSFLILHSWCYGAPTSLTEEQKQELTRLGFSFEGLVNELKDNWTGPEKARNFLNTEKGISNPFIQNKIINKVATLLEPSGKQASNTPKESSFTKSDELSRSEREWLYKYGADFISALKELNVSSISRLTTEKLFKASRNAFESNNLFEPPFWSAFEDKKFLGREVNQIALKTFVSGNDEAVARSIRTFKASDSNINKFTSILQGMLDGKTLQDLKVEEPKATAKPGFNTPQAMPGSIATEAQISSWVNRYGNDIVSQLKENGITNSNKITFEDILNAAKTLPGAPLPKLRSAQQSMLLGRLGFPPPPPPPTPKAPPAAKNIVPKTAEQIAQEQANQAAFGSNNSTSSHASNMTPPPPPMPGKGNMPAQLLLNNDGKSFLVDAIRRAFDNPQASAQSNFPPAPKAAPAPETVTPSATAPLPKAVDRKMVIDALEFANSLTDKIETRPYSQAAIEELEDEAATAYKNLAKDATTTHKMLVEEARKAREAIEAELSSAKAQAPKAPKTSPALQFMLLNTRINKGELTKKEAATFVILADSLQLSDIYIELVQEVKKWLDTDPREDAIFEKE